MFGIAIPVEPNVQQKWLLPPWIVFQGRISGNFEVEQMGPGFPCTDENHAKDAVKLVASRNQKVPTIALCSWHSGFAIAILSPVDMSLDEMVLHKYETPRLIDGVKCGFAIMLFKLILGKQPELVSEEFLHTTDYPTAQRLYQEKHLAIKTQFIAERPKPTISAEETSRQSEILKESQLIVLAKAFPEIVELIRKNSLNHEERYAAYQRDYFALTGKMLEPATPFNPEQFWETVNAARRQKRGKSSVDPVEYELVSGWFMHGYNLMTPENRALKLKERGFPKMTGEAVRKVCEKLKLKSDRKPGKH